MGHLQALVLIVANRCWVGQRIRELAGRPWNGDEVEAELDALDSVVRSNKRFIREYWGERAQKIRELLAVG